MKRTLKELRAIDTEVAKLYREFPHIEKGKFGWAYKRYCEKNLSPLIEELGKKYQDAAIENALEDEKTKEIIRDPMNPRGYKFSKEGEKKCVEVERKLLAEYNAKEIEVEPYIATSIPVELTEELKESLKGLVIK